MLRMPKAKLNESHDTLLNFLKDQGQAWDSDELQDALGLSRSFINRLGKDLAEHELIKLVRTERKTIYSMRYRRRPA